MTVKELKELLSNYPDDMPVLHYSDYGVFCSPRIVEDSLHLYKDESNGEEYWTGRKSSDLAKLVGEFDVITIVEEE